MPITISLETSSGKQPPLWGLGDVTQRFEVVPPMQLSVLPWQQGRIASSAWLETLITPIGHREMEQTPSLVAEINSLLNQVQELGICLGRQDEIREYLLQFPDLIEVIPLAVNAALDHLSEAQLFLEVYHDPEIEDQYLVLYVRVQKYAESVMEQIEAAEREYIDFLIGKEGWLQLSTDFREPEFA